MASYLLVALATISVCSAIPKERPTRLDDIARELQVLSRQMATLEPGPKLLNALGERLTQLEQVDAGARLSHLEGEIGRIVNSPPRPYRTLPNKPSQRSRPMQQSEPRR